MNLFPEPRPGGRSGGEAGAARGCSAPAPSRRTAGFAGVWVWLPVRRPAAGVSQPVPAPSPMLFYRRPFAEGLFRRPVLWVRCRFFVPGGTARTSSFSSLSPLRSDPSPLRPLSAPTPLCSAPSLSRSCPVPVPFLSRSCPVPVPFLSRSCPVPVPFLSRSCPVPVPFLSPLRSVPILSPPSSPPSSPSPSPLLAGRRFVAFFRSEG